MADHKALILALGAAALAACSARRSEPIAAPLTLISAEARRGRALYAVHCDRCHPGGEGGLGPGINNKPFAGRLARVQARRGFGAHPPFPKERLPNGDLDAILAFLKELRRNARR